MLFFLVGTAGCSPPSLQQDKDIQNAMNPQEQDDDDSDSSGLEPGNNPGVVNPPIQPLGPVPPSTATAIAHWDVVPYQDFTGDLRVGVIAAHHRGIQKVRFWVTQTGAFSADPQFEVNQTSTNPATADTRAWGPMPTIARPPAEDYSITLKASDYTSGVPIRVRAIAVPWAGNPKTVLLPSAGGADFITFTPFNTTPPRNKYYAAQGADYANNTQCTQAAPCPTLQRVFQKIVQDGGAAGISNAEILLGPSTQSPWTLEGAGAPNLPGQLRWLVIRSANGDGTNVRVHPFPNGYVPSWSVELTKFEDVTLIGPMYCSYQNGANKRHLWMNRVGVVGNGLATIQQGDSWNITGGLDGTMWTASYLTESFMDYLASGPRGQELARNVYAIRTGDGHSSGSATVINYTLMTAYGSNYNFPGLGVGPDYHGDVYQMWARRQNIILYGLRIQPGGYLSLRGIVGSSPDTYGNVAILNTDLDLTMNGQGQWVFSFCASTAGHIMDHFVIDKTRLVGSGHLCGESSSATFEPNNLRNILYRNSVFVNGSATQLPLPWNLPSVRAFPCPQGAMFCDGEF